jgi:hypothetical protein
MMKKDSKTKSKYAVKKDSGKQMYGGFEKKYMEKYLLKINPTRKPQ